MSPEQVSIAGVAMAAVSIAVACMALAQAARAERGQAALAEKLAAQERLLSQRQFLLPLWDHLSALREINPEQPATPLVVQAVNTLELVALCWEGDLIDRDLIRRTFMTRYLQMYGWIEACGKLPGLNKSGRELLLENPAATKLHDELRREHSAAGALTPLTK